jgi:preprotein translocase subunit YajC
MQSNSAVLLLQAGGPAAGPLGGGFGPIFLGLMFVVMYFFMIRPQSKRAKEQKKFADNMTSGEHIVTTAGIHGDITNVNADGTLKLEVSRNTFLTIDRSAVSMDMTMAARKKADAAAGITPAATK